MTTTTRTDEDIRSATSDMTQKDKNSVVSALLLLSRTFAAEAESNGNVATASRYKVLAQKWRRTAWCIDSPTGCPWPEGGK